MMKVAFVCDTGTGVTPVQLEEYGVYGAPLQITVDDTTKLEGVEISVDEVYGLMQQGKMLKTSLASAEECEKLFTLLKAKGYEMVFAIPICSGLSGTINLMRLTAENVGLKFDYYDCHCTAILERYLCIRAKELYEQGQLYALSDVVVTDYGAHILMLTRTTETTAIAGLYDYACASDNRTVYQMIEDELYNAKLNEYFTKWQNEEILENYDKSVDIYSGRFSNIIEEMSK